MSHLVASPVGFHCRRGCHNRRWKTVENPNMGRFTPPLFCREMLAIVFELTLLGFTLGSVAKIPMWADLYLRSHTDWEEIDFKLSFLMDTYAVVSLEKCLYVGSNDQNTVSMADE